MFLKSRQYGAAAVIMVFILLLIIAGMLTISLYGSSSSISGSLQMQYRQKALFLAETAIQRAQYEINLVGNCAGGVVAETPYASGSFEVKSSVVSGGGCLVQVQGKSHGIVNDLSKMLFLTANMSGSFFEEYTPDAADFNSNWTTTYSRNGSYGGTGWDSANAPGSAGGSMVMYNISVKKPKKIVAYLERPLLSKIDASIATLTLNYSFSLMSSDDTASGIAAQVQDVKLYLTDSTGVTAKLLFFNSANQGLMDNLAIWSTQGPATKKIKKGKVFDTIRAKFLIKSQSYTNTYIFLDDISLSW